MAEEIKLNKSLNQEDSEYDNSDDNLKIVIESPRRKSSPPQLNDSDKLIIETVEKELEVTLDEKAAKTNLNVKHVKNILRQVVTNEHVLALVRNTEYPDEEHESVSVYEPKLTRAKAKELSSVVIPTVPWATPKQPTSEVHVLFSEDLQEDSSGDEYIPGEESEDDRDSSIYSEGDPLSVPPPTPPTPSKSDSCTQTNWTDDGIFKIPAIKSKEEKEEEANIALRTRSKLSLSSTPLEVIEEAFIPPDITTDMYDMDCDDEDWRDFLKKFTRPLDEVIKHAEDEDHDPEYNILADEEIDKVDREELRVDKAVKVTRKELNDLMAELFEFADIYNNSQEEKENSVVNETINDTNINDANVTSQIIKSKSVEEETKLVKVENILIDDNQIPLLEQQLRQHVQMLTQNFLLTFQHPELHSLSIKFKEYLLNLKFLADAKEQSIFYSMNLQEALKLISYWEDLFATDYSDEVKSTKMFVEKVLAEMLERKNSGVTYIPKFPPLIMETISKSKVFMYPSLLPKIPFKSLKFFDGKYSKFFDSESHLIALGLEQFIPIAKENKKNLTNTGEVNYKIIAWYIQNYMMPFRDYSSIYTHIKSSKQPRCANNPIKFFFQNRCAPPTVHYLTALDNSNVCPPCNRKKEELPFQWQQYIFCNDDINASTSSLGIKSVSAIPFIYPQTYETKILERTLLPNGFIVTSTPLPKKNKKSRIQYSKPTKPKSAVPKQTTSTPITNFIKCIKRPSPSQKYQALFPNIFPKPVTAGAVAENKENIHTRDMLPSMPSLGTPIKKNLQQNENTVSVHDKPANIQGIQKCFTVEELETQQCLPQTKLDFSISSITKADLIFEQPKTKSEEVKISDGSLDQPSTSKTQVKEELSNSSSRSSDTSNEKLENRQNSTEKDNLDDINALLLASSTVKPTVKKDSTAAEKKKAKQRREFLANLLIAAPEDPELEKQRDERFALAYYDKMRETLELDDYHKIMQILNDHEGDAVDLYQKVDKIFRPKYEELADEFLLFLRDREAASLGKLIPWIQMNTRSKFLRKLEIYFKDQPAQLRKIYKYLTDLSESNDIKMEKIKATLLPMFKGNTILMDLFLQNFLSEKPPLSLLEGSYETIDLHKEMAKPDDEESYETIAIPDVPDKYGGLSCVCTCHKIEDPEFKSRYRHCIPCGTKFIQGKVYIQSGRGLRPAIVSFLTSPNKDHNVRLNGKSTTGFRKKRSDTSPSKQGSSPSKDNADEETDEDGDGKKKKSAKKSPRKRKIKQPDKKKEPPQKTTSKKSPKHCDINGKSDNPKRPVPKKRLTNSRKSKLDKEEKDIKRIDIVIKEVEEESTVDSDNLKVEPMDWDFTAAPAECLEPKPSSPEQGTAESESEFCEESSQDNCDSDSNTSISSATHSQSDTGEEISWTREEDKIILETFQRENDKEHAFIIISNQLRNRSVCQIRNRFQTLMKLLLEQLGAR